MVKLSFYIVDVFAEKKYAGNQLAVFTSGAEVLSSEEMQQIAREMNFSETTFVVSPQKGDNGYKVRIFTPSQELPFAGHPTLGTAYVLQQAVIQAAVETVTLDLPVGPIPVTLHYREGEVEVLWMQQQPPVFGSTLPAEALAAVLNLPVTAIDDRFPIQEVSTGVPFILVPLRQLDDLRQAKTNRELYFSLVEGTQAKAIFFFCPQTRHPENHLSARLFGEAIGVIEDPATGSANGCLAAYLANYEYFGSVSVDVRVEQGYEMGRPSLLLLKAEKTANTIHVAVGGQVVMVARGEFV